MFVKYDLNSTPGAKSSCIEHNIVTNLPAKLERSHVNSLSKI